MISISTPTTLISQGSHASTQLRNILLPRLMRDVMKGAHALCRRILDIACCPLICI